MLNRFLVLCLAAAFLGGCASSQMKARKEQRDKASQSSKLYCDFVNGELYPDVEVMLNLEMSKRCDSEKSFSLTNYKTSNENMGIIYCCALPERDLKTAKSEPLPPTSAAKKELAPTSAVAPKVTEKAVEKSLEKPVDKAAGKATGGDDELGE